MSAPQPAPSWFPRVPDHAWQWLQRSRPVRAEIAQRLLGSEPPAGFVDDLRRQFEDDPFVRDLVVRVVAEVAFRGRVPTRRPAGASWDRGLLWWAAAMNGVTPSEFEAGGAGTSAQQPPLFPTGNRTAARPVRRVSVERQAVGRALRELLATADGDQIPVSAVRALLAQVDPGASDPGSSGSGEA